MYFLAYLELSGAGKTRSTGLASTRKMGPDARWQDRVRNPGVCALRRRRPSPQTAPSKPRAVPAFGDSNPGRSFVSLFTCPANWGSLRRERAHPGHVARSVVKVDGGLSFLL